MKKHYLTLSLFALSLVTAGCKGGTSEQGKQVDTVQMAAVEEGVEFEREHKAFDATTYFSTIKLGMTPEEVSNVMSELADVEFEWEGLRVSYDFEEMDFDDETGLLRAIYYITEPVGTGEYYFAGEGKFHLYEQKEGAFAYEEMGKKLQRFAQMIAEATGGEVTDCGMQSYSYWSDLGAGSVEALYNYEGRTVAVRGNEMEVGRGYLRFTLQTPDSYAG
ncbi:MAG: hypothetical protein KBT12_07795 [Bacteroidales bacterium]|nr:hypothetical protein [Candidatus Physcousia equi]